MRPFPAAGLLVVTMAPAVAAQAPPLALSHSWIVVTTGVLERKALERAGFRIAPTVNRHEGQGTASVFDRTPATPATLPFATWKVSADWLEQGTFIEMMTPREMPKAVSLSISSYSSSARESDNAALAQDLVKGAVFLHPNGARRLTALRVVAPSADRFPPAASYLAAHGLVTFDTGNRWLFDVTLDNGKQGVTKDLEPELPVVIHY